MNQNKKDGHCSLSQKQYYAFYLPKKLGRGLPWTSLPFPMFFSVKLPVS